MNFYPITPKQYEKILRDIFRKEMEINIILVGSPGIGKTEISKAVAKEFNRAVIELYLSMRDPTDLAGAKIPIEKDNVVKTVTAIPEIVTSAIEAFEKEGKKVVLLFDEFTHASPNTLKCLYQLLLEKKIEKFTLPQGTVALLLGNLDYEGLGWSLEEFPYAFLDRALRFELQLKEEEWFDWAFKNQIHPEVIGFLKNKPEYLYQQSKDIVVTPRSWAKISQILYTFPDNEILIGGVLGSKLTPVFRAWRNVVSSIDVMKILKTKNLPFLNDKEKLLGFCASLISILNRNNEHYEDAMEILPKLDEELIVFILSACPNFKNYMFIKKYDHPFTKEIIKKFKKIFWTEEDNKKA